MDLKLHNLLATLFVVGRGWVERLRDFPFGFPTVEHRRPFSSSPVNVTHPDIQIQTSINLLPAGIVGVNLLPLILLSHK
jgi:hypothetical protein